jgi:hypothetical protein
MSHSRDHSSNIYQPPVLDPSKSKVDGLAFIGLSLCRKSDVGHPDSKTHQTSFDLNEVLDRDYEFIFSTDDNGWLVGGGESGPPLSYKLRATDSAHVELMRIGTFEPEWGGIKMETIVEYVKRNCRIYSLLSQTMNVIVFLRILFFIYKELFNQERFIYLK